MGAEIAERARARGLLLEPPDLGVGRAPVLQVAAPEVLDLAELPGLEQLAGQPHGRHEAVVEGAQVDDAGRLHALPDVVRLGGVAAERLLADDVLAGLGGGHRRLGVQRVRAGVVEQLDLGVGDQLAPVADVALEPELPRGLGHGLLVAARDGHQPRPQRRRPGLVGEGAVAVGVGPAHEGVAQHPDADLGDLVAHERCIAASKATAEGGKSVRRTNARASRAPYSRSIPESSHSTDSGPWYPILVRARKKSSKSTSP